jgi:hypothetical protein
MASIINASSTGSGGIVQTADASGVLQLQCCITMAQTKRRINTQALQVRSGFTNYLFSLTLPQAMGLALGLPEMELFKLILTDLLSAVIWLVNKRKNYVTYIHNHSF